jgi:hypothetical protein
MQKFGTKIFWKAKTKPEGKLTSNYQQPKQIDSRQSHEKWWNHVKVR